MATETIEKVLQKEKEGEAKIAEAKASVIKMEEDAKILSVSTKDKILTDAKNKAEKILQDAQTKAEKIMDDARIEAEKRQNEIAESLSGLNDEAEKIVKEILF